MDHTSRAVLAQADADGTTNEIPSSSRYWTAWSSAAR
jgi:hypothetical protein